ncbi:hypothetical protein L1887_11586 [Cichorium endivia]|nr:hypothetical protein L1887_11586 [Cichorium endivia]
MKSDSRKTLCLLSSVRIVLIIANNLRVCSWNSCELVFVLRPCNTVVVEIARSGVVVKSCTIWATVQLSGWTVWLLAGQCDCLELDRRGCLELDSMDVCGWTGVLTETG